MSYSFRNPFTAVNAAQLEPEKILEYWCNPFTYDLFSEIKQEDIYREEMNIVFMGGRSTGKSMFLRYWSIQVQKMIATNEKQLLLQRITENTGVGFYVRIDGPKLKAFTGYGLSIEHWTSVFTHYFEISIARQYLEFLLALEKEESIKPDELLPQLSQLIGLSGAKSLLDIIHDLDESIKEVEQYLGNVPFYKQEFRPSKRGFLSQSLSFEIPHFLVEHIDQFKGINFVVLLDEYENFSEHQQKVINTLLRFSRSYVKFRIGMRLEGFSTFKMISEDDFVMESREYRKVVFEEVVNKNSDYQDFLIEISRKRLELIPQFKERGITDIKSILTEREDLSYEASEITSGNTERIYDFFSSKLPTRDMDQVRFPQNPLLELLNYLWLLRGISPERVYQAMDDYLSSRETEDGIKYHRDYVHKYKLALTFLLCSIYRKRKLYYSFNTFAFLSSGIIGNFIELCRRAFAEVDWADKDKLLTNGSINKELQSKAAIEYANSLLQQLNRIETYGGAISRFVTNVGNIFRRFHLDFRIRYIEVNQFAVNIDAIEEVEARKCLKAAVNWTVIQRKSQLQSPMPSAGLEITYILNRAYSPAFQISYRTRGAWSLPLSEKEIINLINEENINYDQYLKQDEQARNEQQDLFTDMT